MGHQTGNPGPTMQAISFDRYGGPEVLRLGEWPTPRPGPDEVLIAVRSAAVGIGDCKLRAGRLRAHHPIVLPKIPGRSGAGVVVACGPAVDFAQPGDRVVFGARHTEAGSAAQFIVRGRERTAPLPDDLDVMAASAVIHPALCALIALDEVAKLQPGQSVLIHGGAGAVGGQAVRWARERGARVVATCRHAKADEVRRLGASAVLCYDREDFAATQERFDVVFDTLGGDIHRRSYRVLRPGGTLVCLNAEPFVDQGAAFGVRTITARIEETRARLGRVLDLAARGVFAAPPALALPLAECAEAHRRLEAGTQGNGRIVLAVA
jgi:NADPH:quinone reductase-like Zn-dependent oxidoreductase